MRLFIAIQFPNRIKQALTYVQQNMRDIGIKGNYTSEENLHLTLAFIGEYKDPGYVMDVLEGLSFSSFLIELEGFGNFGDLYWVGIKNGDSLKRCAKQVRHLLADAGVPFDRKRFSPHITVLRKASYGNEPDFDLLHIPDEGMRVKSISLMRSDRGKNGMIYTEIGDISLEDDNVGNGL